MEIAGSDGSSDEEEDSPTKPRVSRMNQRALESNTTQYSMQESHQTSNRLAIPSIDEDQRDQMLEEEGVVALPHIVGKYEEWQKRRKDPRKIHNVDDVEPSKFMQDFDESERRVLKGRQAAVSISDRKRGPSAVGSAPISGKSEILSKKEVKPAKSSNPLEPKEPRQKNRSAQLRGSKGNSLLPTNPEIGDVSAWQSRMLCVSNLHSQATTQDLELIFNKYP